MVDFPVNILSAAGSGPSQQLLGKALAVFGVVLLVVIAIGYGVFMFLNSKRFYITIELYKLVNGKNKLVSKLKTREHKIGRAGDKLWYVAKVGKYIPPGILQSGPNIYKYFERSDGEWINFELGDIDLQMKKAGVKYIHNDMRAQRIAISKALEAELKNDSFWDKYGATITFILEILIFGVACVIIFYQFGEVVGKMDQVVGNLNGVVTNINHLFQNVSFAAQGGGAPAPIFIPPL